MTKKPLTRCQRRVFEFITKRVQTTGCPPSRQEIAGHFGYRSLTTVESHLRLIAKKGYLKVEPKLARGLRLLSPNQPGPRALVNVPLYGSIPAGKPEDREAEVLRYLSVDAETVKTRLSPDAFGLQVKGDSMVGKHILSGDYVIVDPRRSASHGDVVAALIDGETTLKTLVVKNNKSYLKAENPRYSDLVPEENLEIKGVAMAVIRQL
jgi:repressor LexA